MLFGEREFAVQRHDLNSLSSDDEVVGGEGNACQRVACAFDLALAGQEYQYVAIVFGKRELNGATQMERPAALRPSFVRACGRMRDPDRKAAAFAPDPRRIEPARDALAVECRRHDHQTQVRAQVRLHVERKRRAEVAMQMAFVEFVEQDRADAWQLGGVLDHPGQDAFGDDFDARCRGDLRFKANAIAYCLADAFTALRGHELGRRAGGDPARFEQQDLGAGEPVCIEQRGRHLRRLAGAGRCFQHHACGPPERRQKIRQDRVDGQGDSVHAPV